MNLKNLTFALLLAVSILACYFSFAGSTMVYYGRPSGGGCSGTGICSMGANTAGVSTDFSYVANSNGNNVLTLTFNLANAQQQAGFTPDKSGKTYTFTAAYSFSDSNAVQCGVPKGYSIPSGYVATYNPPSGNANCSVVITQKNL